MFTEQPAAATLPGVSPEISIRNSRRARRLAIKVYPRGRVEVVVPRRTRAADVEAFVSENRAWIQNAVDTLNAGLDPRDNQLPDRIALPAIARHYSVTYRLRSESTRVRLRESGNHLQLVGAVDNEERCRLALRRWLSRVARREFQPRLDDLSRRHRLPYRQLHVRAQRSCWGSHSASGTISLNLCLLFVQPDVLRYLLVHELSHGRHMNHSRAFWRLVRRIEPDYRQLDRSLGDAWRQVPGWLNIY